MSQRTLSVEVGCYELDPELKRMTWHVLGSGATRVEAIWNASRAVNFYSKQTIFIRYYQIGTTKNGLPRYHQSNVHLGVHPEKSAVRASRAIGTSHRRTVAAGEPSKEG